MKSLLSNPDPDTAFGRFIIAATTPGIVRSRRIRSALAALLLVIAAVTGISSAVTHDPLVVTAVRQIPPGHTIPADGLKLTPVPSSVVPDGALTTVDQVAGSIAATTLAPREIVTAHHLVGPEAMAGISDSSWASPALVPVSVADSRLASLVHHGDTVTVVAGSGAPRPGAVIAQRVRVMTVVAADGEVSGGGASVLVACDTDTARQIAAATADGPVGLVITGARATPAATASP
ncbi:SAF domain-containing protein [Corynebacterium mendelii]|uniref:SAF domain-containing protein n=1 Tax=Corynebacterium mendelii TaxID=2765362 RepID=A0A939E2X8_9CORY|nr:SAF domain-containing protein [Corynebacterium mendelii]MBN9644716.1 hypothetical protein [Corynebacterium mendelii]